MFTKSKDTASQVYFHSVFSLSVNLSCFHVLNYYQIDLTSHLKGIEGKFKFIIIAMIPLPFASESLSG